MEFELALFYFLKIPTSFLFGSNGQVFPFLLSVWGGWGWLADDEIHSPLSADVTGSSSRTLLLFFLGYCLGWPYFPPLPDPLSLPGLLLQCPVPPS